MALNGTFTVRVQKPGTTLTEAMSEMRVWLDHHQIELVDFGIAETNVSGTAFNLRFRREAEASLFSLAFPSPHPMIVLPLTFDDRRASQSSITRTMSVNDHSLLVTPAAIAGVNSQALMDAHEVVVHEVDRDRMPVVLGDIDDHLPRAGSGRAGGPLIIWHGAGGAQTAVKPARLACYNQTDPLLPPASQDGLSQPTDRPSILSGLPPNPR
jgi:hypothetical protein